MIVKSLIDVKTKERQVRYPLLLRTTQSFSLGEAGYWARTWRTKEGVQSVGTIAYFIISRVILDH